MALREVKHLLVGGGMAAANCAAELRAQGADGEILLVGREPHPPYERPPLSKDFLRGESTAEDAYVHPPEWYAENGVELLSGTNVMSFDAAGRRAKLQGGEEIAFEKALLATGANVNILRVDGSGLDGIHYLRVLGNSEAIRDDVADANRVVLIGGSYIGAEVAASLTAKGKQCAIVMLEDVALSRSFGDEAGRFFHDVLADHGVELHGGEELEAFEGETRVEAVRTKSGRRIECDAVVVGAGVHPDTMLAGRAGLEVENGIVCDAKLQSSVEGIFAAGDVCSYDSVVHGRRLRVEHWDVALQQGRHAARSMLGGEEPYRELPYFFSDLADWASLEYVGPAQEWDEVVWRGDRDAGQWSAWYLSGGRLAAALSVERSEDLPHARRLIESGVDLSPHREALADGGTALESIA
ncbi:MAG: 3-phenylpropionate/trans-cinnamate dioxygenase ferredoxin reductase component [Solirubrobacterales bacterium]|jgi:3-phenylpropionate/trans-cinnamate dioxygenase ferredoxin reductase subunit|nr:3-phenylpropionate/trans-cinnamate dioxygenase ferredoxin reductase component [Solirubrobacterales bacterium]